MNSVLSEDFEEEEENTSEDNAISEVLTERSIEIYSKNKLRKEISHFNNYAYRVRDELNPFEVYEKDCFTYRTCTIAAFKKILKGETNSVFDLSKYIPEETNIYFMFEALLNSPQVKIKEINLTGCPFGAIGCIPLSEYITNSTELTKLNLSNCQIGPEACKILAEGLEYTTTLVDCNLSNCRMGDYGGAFIIRGIRSHPSIEKLNLSKNNLSMESSACLQKLLIDNEILKILNLSWNSFYNEKLATCKILMGLLKNTSLESMDLSWNGLDGKLFAKKLYRVLRKNATLQVLNLSNNAIKQENLEIIFRGIKYNKSLEQFYIDYNLWEIEGLFEFIQIFGSKRNLNLLSLGSQTFVNKPTYYLIRNVLSAKRNKRIIFRGMLLPIDPDPVDFRRVVLARCRYVAQAQEGRHKRDMGIFMLHLLEKPTSHLPRSDFMQLLKDFKAHLDSQLADTLLHIFAEKIPIGKKRTRVLVAIHKMAKYYLTIFPTVRSQRRGRGEKKANKNAPKGRTK